MAESTFEIVRDALAEQLSIDAAGITPASLLADDLGADSLDGVELIIALEERYEVSIDTEDSEALQTVQDVVDLLDKFIPA